MINTLAKEIIFSSNASKFSYTNTSIFILACASLARSVYSPFSLLRKKLVGSMVSSQSSMIKFWCDFFYFIGASQTPLYVKVLKYLILISKAVLFFMQTSFRFSLFFSSYFKSIGCRMKGFSIRFYSMWSILSWPRLFCMAIETLELISDGSKSSPGPSTKLCVF